MNPTIVSVTIDNNWGWELEYPKKSEYFRHEIRNFFLCHCCNLVTFTQGGHFQGW